MSDRILVLHEGRVTAEIARADATEERVMFAATGNLASDPVERRSATGGSMAERRSRPAPPRERGAWLGVLARQRELSLVAIMIVLGALVSLAAPQFLTDRQHLAGRGPRLDRRRGRRRRGARRHHPERRPLGRGDDGPGRLLRRGVAREPARSARPARSSFGIGIGLVARDDQRVHRRGPAGPGDRRHPRHAEHLPRHRLPHRGQPPGPARPAFPPGFTDAAHERHPRDPDLRPRRDRRRRSSGSVFLRWTRFGRQFYAVGSNPEAAAILGIPSRRVVFAAFALCGLLAGIAGVMYVIEFGTINGTSAGGYTLQVVAAVVVGGVGIFGGTGTLAGAALGALFLGFIANALILVGLSQFWLQAIYGLVILVAVSADAVILRRLQRAASLNRSR